MENQNDGEAVERCILVISDYKDDAPFVLRMPTKVKINKPEYKLKNHLAPEMKGMLS